MSIPVTALTFSVDEVGGDRQFEAVVIREGVFQPGIGNPEGSRIFFPKAVLARIAPAFEGKPVNLGHSPRLEDEVGVMTQMRMDQDGERLRSNLVFQKQRPRYMDALGFIKGRLDAGQVPNVSIEIGNVITRPAQAGANYKGQPYDEELVDAEPQGVAILPSGACSDKAGCGIGLASHYEVFHMASVIPPPANPSFTDKPWSAPTFADFGEDLAKAKAYHLVTLEEPPTKFTDLKFPYREPSGGAVNLNALRAILGARGSGANIPSDVKTRAQATARKLLADGNKTLKQAAAALTDEQVLDALGNQVAIEEGLQRGLLIHATSTGADGAAFTVLALQGNDNTETTPMCDQKQLVADLQAKNTALEADLTKERTALKTLTTERDAALSLVKTYEDEEMEALNEAVRLAAPKGTDLKAIVGEKPTKERLLTALAAFKASKPAPAPAAPAAPASTGRRTAAFTRTPAGPLAQGGQDTSARRVAMRARYGLPEKSNLPPSMQRHTDVLLAAAPVEGQEN